MKKNLAIFDFDHTIKEHGETFTLGGRAKLFPGQKIPEEIILCRSKYKKAELSKSFFYETVNNSFNSVNCPKKGVIEAIANDGSLVNGIDQVIKKLFMTHDIIIITGADYETVKLFLAKHNLLTFVKKIYGRPATIYDNGKIVLGDLPKEWAGPCQPCKNGYGNKKDYKVFCKTAILKSYLNNSTNTYERFIYFGDGLNDLCSALSLGANDIVCPRKGFKLESAIKERHFKSIQAALLPWNNGLELLNVLSIIS